MGRSSEGCPPGFASHQSQRGYINIAPSDRTLFQQGLLAVGGKVCLCMFYNSLTQLALL